MPSAWRVSSIEEVGGFKVGLGLLHGPGPGVVGAIADLGKPVFADAKLHDIPSQVETAAAATGPLGSALGHGTCRWRSGNAGGGGFGTCDGGGRRRRHPSG